MPPPAATPTPPTHDLVLERILDVPRPLVWRCWTEPKLMLQWFTPAPWATVRVETDLRVGGSSMVVMRSPEGQEFPNPGVYLEIVWNEKLVFTDAYTSAWVPSAKPFFTGILTFADAGPDKTRYTAVAKHWTKDDCEAHDKMGFHPGWNKAADQLVALAKTLV